MSGPAVSALVPPTSPRGPRARPTRPRPAARSGEPRRDAGHRLELLRRGWWLPAGAAGLCALALGWVQVTAPPRYRAVGVLQLGGAEPPGAPAGPPRLALAASGERAEGAETRRALLSTRAVVERALAPASGAGVDGEAQAAGRPRRLDGVEVRALPGGDLVEVHVVGADPHQVAARADALMEAYVPLCDRLLNTRRGRRAALRAREVELERRIAATAARERDAHAAPGASAQARLDVAAGLHAAQAELVRHRLQRAEAAAERERLELLADAGLLPASDPAAGGEAPELAALRGRAEREADPVARRELAAALRAREVVDVEARRARVGAASAAQAARERGHAIAEGRVRAIVADLEAEARRLEAQARELEALRRERERRERELALVRHDAQRLASELGPDGPAIVDRAAVPSAPEPLVRPLEAALLLVASACAGLLGLLAWDRAAGRVLSAADVLLPGGPPVIARIARGSSRGLDLLRANLVGQLGPGRKAVVVTSSDEHDPRPHLSLALARALAATGERVLLIDADLEGGALSAAFGLAREGGLTEVLGGERKLLEVVLPTSTTGLSLLPAGAPAAPDLLARGRLGALIDIALRHVDHVIVDTPPAATRAEASTAALQVQGVLHVVALGAAQIHRVHDGIRQVESGGGANLGVILVEPGAVSPT